MGRQTPDNGSEEVVQLGDPRFACRISRKTLVWGFLVASLPCAFGAAMLVVVLRMLLTDWSGDISGSVILLAIGVLALWGGMVLWRKANRLRHVQVGVHAAGLCYHNGSTCLTCRWDQVESIRWKVQDHYEETSLAVGWVPIPGTGIPEFSHTTHHITVRRQDGVQLVFTDELENITGLARAIQQETRRIMGCA
jgi:hypothetical protein